MFLFFTLTNFLNVFSSKTIQIRKTVKGMIKNAISSNYKNFWIDFLNAASKLTSESL